MILWKLLLQVWQNYHSLGGDHGCKLLIVIPVSN